MLEIDPYFLSVSRAVDVLARQMLEFHRLMCLTALTCKCSYVQWS